MHEKASMWFKGKLNVVNGQLFLTKRRIVFVKGPNPFVGPLLMVLVKKFGWHIALDIPAEQIKSGTHESWGLQKNVLAITDSEGKVNKF